MKILLCLFAAGLLWSCHPVVPDPATTAYPSTSTEIFDPTAPAATTLIRSMVQEKTINGVASPSDYHYEYRYSYDNPGRLIKLDHWGYLYHNNVGLPGASYANFVHRVATLGYNAAGELTLLTMINLDQQGQPVGAALTFPVVKAGDELVVYSQRALTPAYPFGDQPILRITPGGRVTQLPMPWNELPSAQFALNTFAYDAAGNLKSITLTHLDTQQTLQRSPVLTQIEHARLVNNPFAQQPAYAAAHFLARGGFSNTAITKLLDLSQQMVLSEQIDRWSMQETSLAFTPDGRSQTSYVYHYDSHFLPVTMERTILIWNQVHSDRTTFTY